MAQFTTLARPYAKAAFEVALFEDKLQSWSDMLRQVTSVTLTEQVSAYLSSPSISGEEQAQTVIDICGDEISVSVQNFIHILSENKRLPLLVDIVELFEELKAEQEKSIDVEVVSAYSLNDSAEQKLAEALKKRLQRDVKLNTRVDRSLIGGLVVHAGDLVIDGSVRGKLNKLAETMKA